jgi:hypothetical protein
MKMDVNKLNTSHKNSRINLIKTEQEKNKASPLHLFQRFNVVDNICKIENNPYTHTRKSVNQIINSRFSEFKEKRHISFKDALLPNICINKNSEKFNIKNYKKIIRYKTSLDEILLFFRDFENMKYLMLDEDQVKLFDFMKYPTMQELLEKIKIKQEKKNQNMFSSNRESISQFKNSNLEKLKKFNYGIGMVLESKDDSPINKKFRKSFANNE